MTYREDMFDALRVIAREFAVRETKTVYGYHLVMFEGTVANLSFDAKQVTLEEIEQVVSEVRA